MGKGGSGGSGPAATRRLGLLIFGVAFVVLFAVVAISEGLGDPSVPSGDVALVENTPGDIGKVTQAKFEHALELAAAQTGEKTTPKPGSAKYDELKEQSLNAMFEAIWLQGLAQEWGIEASEKEVEEELAKIKKESFKSPAEFNKFLKESHFTPADVEERVKLQILSKRLQEQLKEKAPEPTQREVEDYYEAAKATQFTQKPSRDFRSIVNKDLKKIEAAKAALSKDNSVKNWTKLAKKYSTDPNTKNSGGLQEKVEEGIEEPLNKAVFSAPEGALEGPVKGTFGYTIFEVVNSTPESVQEFKTVESQIKSTLAQQVEQEFLTNFSFEFSSDWKARTFCASDYTTERCANYRGNGHALSAPEGCYEADPKGGLPKACPAPVAQAIPALPGTVTPLEPKGKPLAQRPRPMGEAGKGEEGAGALPEGALPEEAPSE